MCVYMSTYRNNAIVLVISRAANIIIDAENQHFIAKLIAVRDVLFVHGITTASNYL